MSMLKNKFVLAAVVSFAIAGCSSTPEDTTADDDALAAEDSSQNFLATGVEGGAVDDQAQLVEEVDPELQQRIVYFDFDKATVRSDAIATLQAHAVYLSNNPGARVRVEGHADERGTREYNMALGERRSKAAVSFLVANGASMAQLDMISYGEERPIALGHDDSSWAENRRVELKYTAEAP